MKVAGKLKLKNDTKIVSEKFKSRDFVITTDFDTTYPQYISMQLSQDKCNLLDNINEDALIEVEFNLKGREWNSPNGLKYFNTLDAWKITVNTPQF